MDDVMPARDVRSESGRWRRFAPVWLSAALVSTCLLSVTDIGAQESSRSSMLSRDRYRSGDETLRAFEPVTRAARDSVVKLNVDGQTVALAAVMSADGLAMTKRSELREGKLTCWLAADREVGAELLASDYDLDLALVRVHARGLKPARWATNEVALGQWTISPGIARSPHSVGIISAQPRRIRPQRALIGVLFESSGASARIDEIMSGLGAEKAGLKVGDIILAVNGSAVRNRQQVVDVLRDLREGQTVKVRAKRSEDEFEADVLLMVQPEQDREANRLAGELSRRAHGFEKAIEHDSVLPPWLCGGPLVNLDGQAVGLNIARASRVSTYALPADLVLKTFEKLKASAGTISVSAPRGE